MERRLKLAGPLPVYIRDDSDVIPNTSEIEGEANETFILDQRVLVIATQFGERCLALPIHGVRFSDEKFWIRAEDLPYTQVAARVWRDASRDLVNDAHWSGTQTALENMRHEMILMINARTRVNLRLVAA